MSFVGSPACSSDTLSSILKESQSVKCNEFVQYEQFFLVFLVFYLVAIHFVVFRLSSSSRLPSSKSWSWTRPCKMIFLRETLRENLSSGFISKLECSARRKRRNCMEERSTSHASQAAYCASLNSYVQKPLVGR